MRSTTFLSVLHLHTSVSSSINWVSPNSTFPECLRPSCKLVPISLVITVFSLLVAFDDRTRKMIIAPFTRRMGPTSDRSAPKHSAFKSHDHQTHQPEIGGSRISRSDIKGSRHETKGARRWWHGSAKRTSFTGNQAASESRRSSTNNGRALPQRSTESFRARPGMQEDLEAGREAGTSRAA